MWKIFPEEVIVCYGQRETIFTDSDLDYVTRNIRTVSFTEILLDIPILLAGFLARS